MRLFKVSCEYIEYAGSQIPVRTAQQIFAQQRRSLLTQLVHNFWFISGQQKEFSFHITIQTRSSKRKTSISTSINFSTQTEDTTHSKTSSIRPASEPSLQKSWTEHFSRNDDEQHFSNFSTSYETKSVFDKNMMTSSRPEKRMSSTTQVHDTLSKSYIKLSRRARLKLLPSETMVTCFKISGLQYF